MCDIVGVYRRLSTAKNAGTQLNTRFFAAPASTNAGRNKIKENKILNGYLVKEIIIMLRLYKLCLIKPYLTHKAWLGIIFDTFVCNLNWRALKGLF